jgi:hypothetical protein
MTARAETVPVPRPFHETIIGAFKRATTGGECLLLLELIIETSIPKGHDEKTRIISGGFNWQLVIFVTRKISLPRSLRKQRNNVFKALDH